MIMFKKREFKLRPILNKNTPLNGRLFNKNGEPRPIELEYPHRGLLPSERYYQYFISYKLYPRPQ